MEPISYVVIALVVVWVIARQMRGRYVTLRTTRMTWLPLVLLVLGLAQAEASGVAWTAATVAVVVAELVVSAAFGAARGAAVRLTERDGYLYQQGGWPLVLLWLATLAVRIGVMPLLGGTAAAATAATVYVSLAVTLAAQYAVLAVRVRADGRPLLPAGSDRRSPRAGARIER